MCLAQNGRACRPERAAIGRAGPRTSRLPSDLGAQHFDGVNAAIEALADHHIEFDLGDGLPVHLALVELALVAVEQDQGVDHLLRTMGPLACDPRRLFARAAAMSPRIASCQLLVGLDRRERYRHSHTTPHV